MATVRVAVAMSVPTAPVAVHPQCRRDQVQEGISQQCSHTETDQQQQPIFLCLPVRAYELSQQYSAVRITF